MCSTVQYIPELQYQATSGFGKMCLGQVDGLWEGRKQANSILVMCLTPFEVGGVSKFYNMREVSRGSQGMFISVRVGVFNFQNAFGMWLLNTDLETMPELLWVCECAA